MKIKIDTSDREEIVININDQEYKTQAVNLKSQKLLPFLVECLQKQNANIEDTTEIEVAKGPGSFTGLRVGMSVANALGWVLDIPVNGSKDPVVPNY